MSVAKDHQALREELQVRIFKMVSIGVDDDWISRGYDIFGTVMLIANLVSSILSTYDGLRARFGGIFEFIEAVTVFFFAVDYVLRILTARQLYPNAPKGRAALRFIFSPAGIIDLLSFLPYYLPVFFPAGTAAFRMFRVARIFRLFRINAYYDSLNVITEVLSSKKQQLLSSVFIIVVLMVASSLCMYSVEHEAQPDVFTNAFSGIWWAASTLLTVGYGDIYPITPMGKVLSILITFLGVGMVAIPTGIISAGFVEQYQRLKRYGDYIRTEDIHFIKFELAKRDKWVGKKILEIGLPQGTIIAAVQRGNDTLVPRGDTVLADGDRIVLGAESLKEDTPINIRQITLGPHHEWVGQEIRELDISRQTIILMIRRRGTMLIPRDEMKLFAGDVVYLYSKMHANRYDPVDDEISGEL